MIRRTILAIAAAVLSLAAFHTGNNGPKKYPKGQWIELFNGKNLDGWTPKFSGYKLGVDYKNTFRVEDGLLTVSYDQYDHFNGEYGHLFYKQPFSHYKIRATYRFIGDQVPGGAGWAYRNNGLMLHCQNPKTMGLNQDYPVSIEMQLLGGNGKDPRSTANLCTPGTNVVMDGKLILQHCTNSSSKTYAGDQWVTVEAEVNGNGVVYHMVKGDTVLSYTKPQYDDRDKDAQKLIKKYGHKLIDHGYISVQAESHPTQFKSIEIMPLDD